MQTVETRQETNTYDVDPVLLHRYALFALNRIAQVQ